MIRKTPSLGSIAAAIATLCVASAARADGSLGGEARWMPVQIGTIKTFVHRQDRRLETQGESLGDEHWVGTREEQVLAAPSEIEGATAELRVTTRLASPVEGEQVETQRLFVSPTASAYQIHASELEASGQRYAIQYPSPAIALAEDAQPGKKWHVSSEDVAGLKGDTWGEVLGIQDAHTPAGLFEACLVVRYTVELTGTIEVPGAGPMEVTDGKMAVTEWHAKGVGLVLAKEELSETLTGANGVVVVAEMTSQSSLKSLVGFASSDSDELAPSALSAPSAPLPASPAQ